MGLGTGDYYCRSCGTPMPIINPPDQCILCRSTTAQFAPDPAHGKSWRGTVDLTVFPARRADRDGWREGAVMTATLQGVTAKKRKPEPEASAEAEAAKELVRRAREQGLSLTGPDGLLKQLTKTVLETALNEEMTEHLGHEKHGAATSESGNIRNGSRPKTVLTESTGQVGIDVPRDRAGTFAPQIVKKRQRRLNGVDEVVLSLYAKGLTTGEISAHFADLRRVGEQGDDLPDHRQGDRGDERVGRPAQRLLETARSTRSSTSTPWW